MIEDLKEIAKLLKNKVLAISKNHSVSTFTIIITFFKYLTHEKNYTFI